MTLPVFTFFDTTLYSKQASSILFWCFIFCDENRVKILDVLGKFLTPR